MNKPPSQLFSLLTKLLLSLLIAAMVAFPSSDAAVPLSSSTRPFIWATMDERDDILQKITDHAWASSMRDQLVARVQNDLDRFPNELAEKRHK